jgi:hypothetical protein
MSATSGTKIFAKTMGARAPQETVARCATCVTSGRPTNLYYYVNFFFLTDEKHSYVLFSNIDSNIMLADLPNVSSGQEPYFFFLLYVFGIFIIFSSVAPHRGQPSAKCHPR